MATKTEVERLGVLETKVDIISGDVKDIKASIESLDKKFAAKWVQTIVAGLVAAVLLAFIGVVLAYFIPRKNGNSPTTTTTTNTPTGSTSTTQDTPSANASATSHSDAANPSDSQTSSSGGLLDGVLKQVTN